MVVRQHEDHVHRPARDGGGAEPRQSVGAHRQRIEHRRQRAVRDLDDQDSAKTVARHRQQGEHVADLQEPQSEHQRRDVDACGAVRVGREQHEERFAEEIRHDRAGRREHDQRRDAGKDRAARVIERGSRIARLRPLEDDRAHELRQTAGQDHAGTDAIW
jgi:hypothetical protein